MCKRLLATDPLFSSDFNKTEFSRQIFRKRVQLSNFIKIPSVGVELFHADGRTDTTTLTDGPKNQSVNAV